MSQTPACLLALTVLLMAAPACAQDAPPAGDLTPPQVTSQSCWNPYAGQPRPLPAWLAAPPALVAADAASDAAAPAQPPAPESFTQTVQASWYARHFQGRKTASGELYNRQAWSAAHREWPMPSWVEVSSPDGQRKVVVRVNDRGPFHKGRGIDLSESAAEAVGLVQSPGMALQLRPMALEEVWAQLCPTEPPAENSWPSWAKQAELQHSYTPHAKGYWLQWPLQKNRQQTEQLWQRLLRDQPELRPLLAMYHDRQGLRLQAGPFPSAAFALGMSPPNEPPHKLIERR